MQIMSGGFRVEFLKKTVLILSLALSVGLGCLLVMLARDSGIADRKRAMIIIFIVVFLLAGVVIVICTRLLIRTVRYEEKNKILQTELEQKSEMYAKVNAIYDQTRMLNHDLKSYLLVILGLLENDECEEAKKRIVEIVDQRLGYHVVQYASSGEVNAVLNDKATAAVRKNIKLDVRVSGEIPKEKTMDTAIILANLLDNALEAAANEPDKRISLDMYERKGMYYINVSNPVSESVLHKNPTLRTSKKDKKNHGIGINSVRYLVNQLDGVFQLEEKDGIFRSYVSFPLEKD